VTTIAGAVSLAAGLVLLVIGLADVSTVEDAEPGTEWSSLEGAHDRAPWLTGIGSVAAGVGAVALTGGILWITTSDDELLVAGSLRSEF
jgi:hypothetical protein